MFGAGFEEVGGSEEGADLVCSVGRLSVSMYLVRVYVDFEGHVGKFECGDGRVIATLKMWDREYPRDRPERALSRTQPHLSHFLIYSSFLIW
jgi:hypothetical protein